MPQGYTSPVFGQILSAVGALADEAKFKRREQAIKDKSLLDFQRGLTGRQYQNFSSYANDPEMSSTQQGQARSFMDALFQTGERQTVEPGTFDVAKAPLPESMFRGPLEHINQDRQFTEKERGAFAQTLGQYDVESARTKKSQEQARWMSSQVTKRATADAGNGAGGVQRKIEASKAKSTLATTTRIESNLRANLRQMDDDIKMARIDGDSPESMAKRKFIEETIKMAQDLQNREYDDPANFNRDAKLLQKRIRALEKGNKGIAEANKNPASLRNNPPLAPQYQRGQGPRRYTPAQVAKNDSTALSKIAGYTQ